MNIQHITHESSFTSLISHLIKIVALPCLRDRVDSDDGGGDVSLIQVDRMNKTDFDISLTRA